MSKNINKFIINKQIFISITIATAIAFYFFYYALFSSKGVFQYFQLTKELQKKELIKESLENKVNEKQHLVNGMNLESLDLDLLDEEARKNLGYANKDEIVIYKQQN